VAGLLTAILLSFALVYALAEIMHIGWAALIVGALWAVAAFAFQASARQKMSTIKALPMTTETLKGNAQLQNPTK
jgi:hypothetical protein